MKIKYFILFIIFLCSLQTYASHIRAGDITASRDAINYHKYTITLTIYYNAARIVPNGGPVAINDETIYFGDGSSVNVNYSSIQNVSAITTKAVYVTTHIYPGAGNYVASFRESYRIDAIQNISQSGSQDFYIETQITSSPLLGLDVLPVLLVPPVDFANVNKIYTETPGAYDADGDSLTFDFAIPEIGNGLNAPGYVSPADPRFLGVSTDGKPATITIDHQTGQIIWNTPGSLNIDTSDPNSVTYYNIAIKVTEWRSRIAIGYVIRDMQIIVRNADNNPPVLHYKPEMCIEAGKELRDTISVTDPDDNMVGLVWYGAPFLFSSPNNANITPRGNLNPQATSPIPAAFYFSWTPACSVVRAQPYTVEYSAEDIVAADRKLIDQRTAIIHVLGPKPVWSATPLTVEGANLNNVRLNWNDYTNLGCTQAGIVFNIYRAECDSVFIRDSCNVTVDNHYQLVAQVPAAALTYLDNNNNKGLKKGVKYYYIIQAIFPSPARGKSQLSATKGVPVFTDSPLTTDIVVDSTSAKNGSVKIDWRKPTDISGLTPPFTYQVYRAKGYSTNFGTNPIATYILTGPLVDSSYSDIIAGADTLNTSSNAYSYKVVLKDALGITRTSEPTSTVFLKAFSLDKAAKLTWKTSFPWAIDHYDIYYKRRIDNGFTKITANITVFDSVYQVGNLTNCDTFIVYIEAIGRYCIDNNQDLIIGRSQEVYVVPISNQPFTPQLTVAGGCAGMSCDVALSAPYQNKLSWTTGNIGSCDQIRTINIYYTPLDNQVMVLLHKTLPHDTSSSYIHAKDDGYAGCYEIETVINVDGKEVKSSRSNRVCVDNCFCFDLPNVFTPNTEDNVNSLFIPMLPARFIEKVDFKVYNRWGKLIFKRDDDVNIHWDGKDVPDGIYYYSADVVYQSVYSDQRQKAFKGWVQIIR